jgi:hypothetical protein
MNEAAAIEAGKRMIVERAGQKPMPDDTQGPQDLYGNAKYA